MDIKIPWVEKYRPEKLEDVLLSDTLKAHIESIVSKGADAMPNMLFVGPAGTGKTTLAKVIAKSFNAPYLYINMSEEGNVDTIRGTVKSFSTTATVDDSIKIVIGDEADGISRQGQDSFRAMQESVHKTTRFIFTCNYPERISPAIKSRLKEVYFSPVSEKLIMKKILEILRAESITIPKDAAPNLVKLIKRNYPDIRKIINHLQFFCSTGTLDITFDELLSEEFFADFCKYIAEKKLSELRDLLKSNRVDYDGTMRQVFNLMINDQSPWPVNENKKAEIIMNLNDYLRWSLNMVIDKEINFTAWAIDLMQTLSRGEK